MPIIILIKSVLLLLRRMSTTLLFSDSLVAERVVRQEENAQYYHRKYYLYLVADIDSIGLFWTMVRCYQDIDLLYFRDGDGRNLLTRLQWGIHN